MTACLFCRITAGEIPCAKVYEDDRVLAFEDIHPQAPVHILIIPKVHFATLADVPETETGLLGHLVVVANRIAKDKELDLGYRVVINCRQDAGQEVFHLHYHLLGGRKFTWPPG